MPTGYSYHKDLYKSPPPAKVSDLGYEYSDDKNTDIVRMWRTKSSLLLDKLERESGMSTGKIYVRAPEFLTPQNMTFDHTLRAALQERGYEIVSDRYEGKILTYAIIDPDTLKEEDERNIYDYNESYEADLPDYNPHKDYKKMILELSLYDKTRPVVSIGGVYEVPMFGYERYELPFTETVAGQKSTGVYDAKEKRWNE